MRAFVKMRERLADDAAILKRLAEIGATLLEHDSTLRETWEQGFCRSRATWSRGSRGSWTSSGICPPAAGEYGTR